MITPSVKDFFSNNVTIRLKNGHKFEGLLSQINYKNESLVLQDVEDLGNQTDKNFIPQDKKIADKAFECDNIEQIFFKQKHFCEPKKYNKDEFWDAVSEPVAQQGKYKQKSYGQKGDKPYYQKKNYEDRGDNRGGYDNRRGDNRRRQNNNYNRDNNNYRDNRGGYKNYNQKSGNTTEYRRRQQNPKTFPKKEEEQNDRDYR